MKNLITALFLFCFLKSTAQGDAENIYFNFLQPSLYNPAFQPKKNIPSIISIYQKRLDKKYGFLNLRGGINIPFKKWNINTGFNYSSFQKFKNEYHFQYTGMYLNYKTPSTSNWAISFGTELGFKTEAYFIKKDIVSSFPSISILKKGNYYGTNIHLSIGANFYLPNFYFGVNCQNCSNDGYHISGWRSISKFGNVANWYFQAGYEKEINNVFQLKIDGQIKSSYPAYANLFFTGILKNKLLFGLSPQIGDAFYVVYISGFKWKNYWINAAFRPKGHGFKNRTTFEVAVQLFFDG